MGIINSSNAGNIVKHADHNRGLAPARAHNLTAKDSTHKMRKESNNPWSQIRNLNHFKTDTDCHPFWSNFGKTTLTRSSSENRKFWPSLITKHFSNEES